jgi:WXG100 family type VII secretion target
MAQAAQKLDDAANVVKGIQSQLHGHKAQLRSNWEGSAAMAFDRVFQAFDEDFTKVLTAMQGMHEKLVHTRIKYESAEQEQEAAVNKISALLNNS